MRNFTSLKDYIDNSELTKEMTEKIILECSKYNKELKNYLAYHKWLEVPGNAIKKFVYAYQESKSNIKTGEIIKPSEMIESIILLQPLEDLSVGLAFASSTLADIPCCELVVEERDALDNLIFTSYFGHDSFGIDFDFFNKDDYSFYDEQAFFKLSRVNPLTKKINIYVSFADELATLIDPFDEVVACLMEDNAVLDEIDITGALNNKKEPLIYQFVWDINEWKLTFGPIK